MEHKPDWPAARERLTALWAGEVLDRPCIAVTAPSGHAVDRPDLPDDPAGRWLDPVHLRGLARAALRSTWSGGEAIPSLLLNAGWVVSLGGRPRFSPQTIWFDPREVDVAAPSPFHHDHQDPWVCRHRAGYLALADLAGRDRFLVGSPCLLPANDLLSMHLGPQCFLTPLVDHPDWMRRAILQGAHDLLQARGELRGLVAGRHDFWYGNAGWMPFWAPEPYWPTQSDVSCMLSKRRSAAANGRLLHRPSSRLQARPKHVFAAFVVPELTVYGESHGDLWYRLDGVHARHQLGHLLDLPFVRVVQYTPAPGDPANGPAHLELYRRIQAAGRIVHIQVPPAHVEPLLCELDSARLVLQASCPSPAEGEALLEASAQWTGRASARTCTQPAR
ncbi:MAG: hypothetical protein AB1505_10590 [Candidatus Latescibacterota bacterium]